MKLKAGHGYWETSKYPIGGCFRRAGDEGKEIKKTLRQIKPPYKGCDAEVEFSDGTTGALKTSNTE